jgi:hypothetical protein
MSESRRCLKRQAALVGDDDYGFVCKMRSAGRRMLRQKLVYFLCLFSVRMRGCEMKMELSNLIAASAHLMSYRSTKLEHRRSCLGSHHHVERTLDATFHNNASHHHNLERVVFEL